MNSHRTTHMQSPHTHTQPQRHKHSEGMWMWYTHVAHSTQWQNELKFLTPSPSLAPSLLFGRRLTLLHSASSRCFCFFWFHLLLSSAVRSVFVFLRTHSQHEKCSIYTRCTSTLNEIYCFLHCSWVYVCGLINEWNSRWISFECWIEFHCERIQTRARPHTSIVCVDTGMIVVWVSAFCHFGFSHFSLASCYSSILVLLHFFLLPTTSRTSRHTHTLIRSLMWTERVIENRVITIERDEDDGGGGGGSGGNKEAIVEEVAKKKKKNGWSALYMPIRCGFDRWCFWRHASLSARAVTHTHTHRQFWKRNEKKYISLLWVVFIRPFHVAVWRLFINRKVFVCFVSFTHRHTHIARASGFVSVVAMADDSFGFLDFGVLVRYACWKIPFANVLFCIFLLRCPHISNAHYENHLLLFSSAVSVFVCDVMCVLYPICVHKKRRWTLLSTLWSVQCTDSNTHTHTSTLASLKIFLLIFRKRTHITYSGYILRLLGKTHIVSFHDHVSLNSVRLNNNTHLIDFHFIFVFEVPTPSRSVDESFRCASLSECTFGFSAHLSLSWFRLTNFLSFPFSYRRIQNGIAGK